MILQEIAARLDLADVFRGERGLREGVRAQLKSAGDPARGLTRLLLGRGGPRDLAALARALKEGEALVAAFARARLHPAPARLDQCLDALSLAARPALAALVQDVGRALTDEPPLLARDGGFIAPGWSAPLDESRKLRDESRRVVAGLQAQYAQTTGVASLKVKHNNVLGYFIEVSAKNADALMGDDAFIHRQTLANAVRFSTPELGELEAKIAKAGERAVALELEMFEDLRARIEAEADAVRGAAAALAELDLAAASAHWAEETGACRPVVDDSLAFEIEAGRHPVVETALKRSGEGRFTPNGCSLDGGGEAGARLMLVTGPNMAGKSTFLRQNALMAILAQAGFTRRPSQPASAWWTGLFSRVGAADDLARGRSTFMAEMIETAAILNQAGPRALVILDEIGRGTATFDGLSIAWAVVEHLHEVNRCRALFATHYHELTRLADELSATGNLSLRAKEWQGDLVFLHEVQPGPADRSYGVQVAKRAGLPPGGRGARPGRSGPLVARARETASPGPSGSRRRAGWRALADLPLFSAVQYLVRARVRDYFEYPRTRSDE